MFKEVEKCIKEANTICLAAHKFPDGDAIGSVGAMYNALKEMGKEVYMVLPSITPKFKFLPYIDKAIDKVPLEAYDLLISLDTSTKDRMDILEEDVAKAKKMIVIDHHKNNSIEADVRIVDEESPANCELVYKLIKYMNNEISFNVANYIYLGLMTDTGSFNYERTTGDTYRIAGEMVDCGAEFTNICKVLNDTYTESKMKLIAHVIENMEVYFDGRVRISVIDENIKNKFNATNEDAENLVNYLRCIEGTIIGIYIKSIDENTYKVSMRAEEPIDASEICKIFNGGGHKRAAGFNTENLEETKKKLLEILERLLESENNRNT